LTGGARDLPSRQRTLRNTIQWSYDLLTPQEQRLFRRLSAFVGGCTLHAAAAVCQDERDEHEGPLDVLEGAASLVDKNFVLQIEREGDEPRLLMLETMREYGLESLEASRETETLCRVHARYYLRLAEEALAHLEEVEQAVRLEQLERESANMRAALLWAVEHQESEMALRLGGALFRIWEARRYLREGKSFLDRALTSSQSIAAGQVKALYTMGFLTTFQRGIERVVLLGREAGVGHRDLGDSHKLAFSFYLLAYIAWATGDFATACSHAEEGLAVARGSDATVILASLLVLLGQVTFNEGGASRARELLEEGLALQRASGNTRGCVLTLSHLIRVLFAQDEVSLARACNEERLVLSRELDFHWGIADSLTVQGHLALQEGNEAGAEELFKESLMLLRAVNDNGAVAACLHSIGVAIAMQGRLLETAWLWGASEAMCTTLGESLLPVELSLAAHGVIAVRAELGEETFTTAWIQGLSMTPEQAFALLERSKSRGKCQQASPSATNELTAREMEVLRLLVEGLTNAQIARRLVIGLVTVNSHVRSIYSKLGVSSRAAATRFTLEQHLL
jgi:DNA-binding CsgD family transcriptional regulator